MRRAVRITRSAISPRLATRMVSKFFTLGGPAGIEDMFNDAHIDTPAQHPSQPAYPQLPYDPFPPGGRAGQREGAGILGTQGGEGAVVADRDDRAAHGRVHGAVGDPGGTQGGFDAQCTGGFCGGRMPPGTSLSDPIRDAIRAWITAGAVNDCP